MGKVIEVEFSCIINDEVKKALTIEKENYIQKNINRIDNDEHDFSPTDN